MSKQLDLSITKDVPAMDYTNFYLIKIDHDDPP